VLGFVSIKSITSFAGAVSEEIGDQIVSAAAEALKFRAGYRERVFRVNRTG
jgi:hypothetical protein